MIHVCSFLMVFLSVWEDIRKQKIYLMPVLIFSMIGILLGFGLNDYSFSYVIKGWIPGCVCILVSRLCGDCIGMGDCILVLGVGMLEGLTFCIKLLGIACVNIFFFSIIMMVMGKLHRKSRVACVPFLMIGYLGAWFI